MKKENSYYVYFSIKGEFDVEKVKNDLNLPVFRMWKDSELRRDGHPYGFSHLAICKEEEYDPYVTNNLEKIVDLLTNKKEYLNKLRASSNVEYSLIVVPHIALNTVYPSLSPSLKVMDFCSETRTKLDIDLYLYK